MSMWLSNHSKESWGLEEGIREINGNKKSKVGKKNLEGREKFVPPQQYHRCLSNSSSNSEKKVTR